MRRALRRGGVLAAVLLVGAAIYFAPKGATNDDAGGDAPAAPRIPVTWVGVPAEALGWDVAIEIPQEWAEGAKGLRGEEVHLGGPPDDGVVPELIYGWKRTESGLDEWGRSEIRKKEALGITVGERGTCTVAGRPALWCIETYKGGGGRQMRRFNVYYATDRGIGFVYGISTARTFYDYRSIFAEAAARIRYVPPAAPPK
jgi:hypothetical protein